MKRFRLALWLLFAMLTMPSFADQLFQNIPTDFTPSRYENGLPYDWRNYGATATHVDRSIGWAWKHTGGDWIDRAGVSQGTSNWISFQANSVTGTTTSYRYSVDVTSMEQHVQEARTWNAFILKAGASSRSIAGAKNAAAPVISVVYKDGTAAALKCIYSTRLTTSTVYNQSNNITHVLPAVLEFEKPTKEVSSAILLMTVTSHPSGKSTVTGNLVDPPMNKNPVEYGLAQGSKPLDEGLAENPQIIGSHRYLDGTTRDQFIAPKGFNIFAERDFDPFIWGRGPHDYTKLPHKDNGKWIAAGENWELVRSDYRGEGFAPLAPGVGAMKVEMPAEDIGNGSIVGMYGTKASIAQIFMPEPDYANLDTVYVRYYIRWGKPLDNTFSKRYEVFEKAGRPPAWTDMGGKIGISPDGSTTYGGVSGTSGGGYGWQMRLQWSDRNPELGPPTGGATTLGVHTFDYSVNNPRGYRYGDGKLPHMLGEQGGGYGVFWPGRWYCIEMMVNLNTVMPEAPGYVPDGEVKVWVDGHLALHMPNMVMRSLPLHAVQYKEGFIRPARQVGITNLQFNWFHGGRTKNSVDRIVFLTQPVWGRQYIGPMRMMEAPTASIPRTIH